MRQRIVFQVQMPTPHCPRKALITVAEACGVESIALQGINNVVVIGDGIDIVKLAKRLKNKVGYTDILSVNELQSNNNHNHNNNYYQH